MTPTALRPTPTPRLRRSGQVLGLVAGVALVAALTSAVASAVRAPADVAALTIDNPTVYQLNVEVSPTGTGDWLDLGAVGRERSKTVEQIADQGRQWVFRFSYGGLEGGRLVVDRGMLAGAHWTVRVPPEAGERLRAAHLQPSAF